MRFVLLMFLVSIATNGFSQQKDEYESYKSLETLKEGLFYLENLYVDPDKVQRSNVVHNALKGVVADEFTHSGLTK